MGFYGDILWAMVIYLFGNYWDIATIKGYKRVILIELIFLRCAFSMI